MLKETTIKDLKDTFQDVSDLDDLNISSGVEVVNLDLIRIHINARGNRQYVYTIFDILKKNNEPGPLTIHEEAATSCNILWYIDIIKG